MNTFSGTEYKSRTDTLIHVEDDQITANATKRAIEYWPEIVHLGIAETGCDALAMCREARPAIILLDLVLPDMDGFTVAEAMAKIIRPPRVLAFTGRVDEAFIYRATQGLVHGVLWKAGNAFEQLRPAIQTLLSGREYFPPEFLAAVRWLRSRPDAFTKILSDRELALLSLFGRGDTDQEIARLVSLSSSAVHSHRQNIMAKLGLHSTSGLMQWCLKKGFVQISRTAPPCVSVE